MDLIEKLKEIMTNQSITRHPPIFIYGNEGSGKTTLIRNLYRQCENWLNSRLLRIIRFVTATPRSSYSLELTRIICQQICIALKLPEGFLPKDASFDPLYVNNWFQSLMRLFEELNQTLVIFIDDIHLLNPLDSDVTSVLSWLPLNLPNNVHLICTTGVQIDRLRLTSVQKDRLKVPEYYFNLPLVEPSVSKIEEIFMNLEETFGDFAISRLCSLLSCTEFGLTETEMLELLMPTNNNEPIIRLEEANFNFSSFCAVRRKLGEIKEK